MTARYIVGDVFDALASLPENSVDLVCTSPPFLALRSYLPADHPDKAKEIGAEPTPGEFIDTLLDVTEALDRVLAPHGSICVELGDTYSGSGGGGGDYLEGGMREGQPGLGGTVDRQREGNAEHWRMKNRNRAAWPQPKSLCLIPELYRLALVYGVNPLTGRQTPRWRVRNVVRWHRPNPPVGALGDKFRPATTDMVIACKSAKRYFDLDAVRHEPINPDADRSKYAVGKSRWGDIPNSDDTNGRGFGNHPAGAPPLDTWIIPTQPYPGAHYATFPEALVVRPIQSMCPQRVCRVCGEPSWRIVEATYEAHGPKRDENKSVRGGAGGSGQHAQAFENGRATKITDTIGWTDCGHDDYRRGVVLDPFAGSGTVLEVASGHGRDSVGIDLDARNAELAQHRVGMFLEVDYPESVA